MSAIAGQESGVSLISFQNTQGCEQRQLHGTADLQRKFHPSGGERRRGPRFAGSQRV